MHCSLRLLTFRDGMVNFGLIEEAKPIFLFLAGKGRCSSERVSEKGAMGVEAVQIAPFLWPGPIFMKTLPVEAS